MVLSVRAGATVAGRAWVPPRSAARACCALTVAAAVAGAAFLSAQPVGPTDLQQQAVRLLSGSGNVPDGASSLIDAWTNVFTHASDNIAAIRQAMTETGQPSALFAELQDIQSGYDQTLASAFEAIASANQQLSADLSQTFDNIMGDVAAGKFVQAFSDIDVNFLDGLKPFLGPLDDVTAIPGSQVQHFADVFQAVTNVDFLAGLSKQFASPQIAATFAAMIDLEKIYAAFQNGSLPTAFNTIARLPADYVDGYLNGLDTHYDGPSGTADFQLEGLLSPTIEGDHGPLYGGLVANMLVNLPRYLTEVLAGTSPASGGQPDQEAGSAAATALLGNDTSSADVFGHGATTALGSDLDAVFDPGAAADGAAGSAIDWLSF
jgi:pyrroline-5-carboxylate reductase